MTRLIGFFFGVFLVLAPLWAQAAGMLEAGANSPYAQFSTSAIVTGDTQIKAVPGFLQCIMISQNDAAPTAGTIIVYDNTAESGTAVFNWTLTTAVFTPFQICPQRPMTTGIYIGFTTTNDVNVSVSYR